MVFRGLRNVVFRSGAPPIFAVVSIVLFVVSIVTFWLWMSFASDLPLSPCKPTATLIHFRSSALCATSAQVTHWMRLGLLWKVLLMASFVVHLCGIAYKKFNAPQRRR